MKYNKMIALIFASITVGFTSQAGTVNPSDVTNNVSSTFTTADGFLILNGFADSTSTVPTNFYSTANYFGPGSGADMAGTATMTMQFAPGVGLTGFDAIWTRAVITISGFTADPGLDVGSDPNVISSGYSSGILTLSLGWDGGTKYDFTLSNPGASAGQTLVASLDYATSPQWAIAGLNYAAVPEPSPAAMSLVGLAMFGAVRRFRRQS